MKAADLLQYIAQLVDLGATLLLALGALRCVAAYVVRFGELYPTELLRENFARVVLFVLQLKLAAGLIKLMNVATWQQLGFFVSLVALRFLLGKTFRRMLPA